MAVMALDLRISRAFWLERILLTFFSWGFNFFCFFAGLIFSMRVLRETQGDDDWKNTMNLLDSDSTELVEDAGENDDDEDDADPECDGLASGEDHAVAKLLEFIQLQVGGRSYKWHTMPGPLLWDWSICCSFHFYSYGSVWWCFRDILCPKTGYLKQQLFIESANGSSVLAEHEAIWLDICPVNIATKYSKLTSQSLFTSTSNYFRLVACFGQDVWRVAGAMAARQRGAGVGI